MIEIEKMAPAIEAPNPVEHGALEFVSPVDEEQSQRTDNIEVRIFTKENKIKGRVGAALSNWNSEACTSALKLGPSS